GSEKGVGRQERKLGFTPNDNRRIHGERVVGAVGPERRPVRTKLVADGLVRELASVVAKLVVYRVRGKPVAKKSQIDGRLSLREKLRTIQVLTGQGSCG